MNTRSRSTPIPPSTPVRATRRSLRTPPPAPRKPKSVPRVPADNGDDDAPIFMRHKRSHSKHQDAPRKRTAAPGFAFAASPPVAPLTELLLGGGGLSAIVPSIPRERAADTMTRMADLACKTKAVRALTVVCMVGDNPRTRDIRYLGDPCVAGLRGMIARKFDLGGARFALFNDTEAPITNPLMRASAYAVVPGSTITARPVPAGSRLDSREPVTVSVSYYAPASLSMRIWTRVNALPDEPLRVFLDRMLMTVSNVGPVGALIGANIEQDARLNNEHRVSLQREADAGLTVAECGLRRDSTLELGAYWQ